jgi:hypothetical protein
VFGTGFSGPVEFEILSERDWWRQSPDQVAAVCVNRCAALTGSRNRSRTPQRGG